MKKRTKIILAILILIAIGLVSFVIHKNQISASTVNINDQVSTNNIALGKIFTFDPKPNYTSTMANDATDLTDGKHVSAACLWCGHPESVAWQYQKSVMTTIDLGSDQPISEVKFYSAAQLGNVSWPKNIFVMVSSDNVNYFLAGDMVASSPPPPLTVTGTNVKYTFDLTGLNTHGQYVKLLTIPTNMVVVDEVEVMTGGTNKTYSGIQLEGNKDSIISTIKLINRLRLDLVKIKSNAEKVNLNLTANINTVSSNIDHFTGSPNNDQLSTVVPQDPNTAAGKIQADTLKLNATVLRANKLSGSVIWSENQWNSLDPYDIPPANHSLSPVQLNMMNGEKRGSTINITNSTDVAKTVTINAKGFDGNDNPDWIKIYKLQPTDTFDNQIVSDMMIELTKGATGYTIDMPSGLTGQIWIEYEPTGLITGDTKGSISINDASTTKDVPVTLSISPYKFPEKLSLHFGGFDYADRAIVANSYDFQITAKNKNAVIDMMNQYQVDMPWATPSTFGARSLTSRNFDAQNNFIPPTKYFENFDTWIAAFPNAYQYFISIAVDINGDFAGSNIFTDTTKVNAMIASWMNAWEDHLVNHKPNKIEPNKVAFLIFDEPDSVAKEKVTIYWGQALRDRVKKYNSHIQLFEDTSGLYGKLPSDSVPVNGDTVYSVSDILCPGEGLFFPQTDAKGSFDFFTKKGKTLATYGMHHNLNDPYALNIMRGWLAYTNQSQAVNYWSLGNAGGPHGVTNLNAYAAVDTQFSPLYFDGTNVYTSKHMEAIYESREDFEYLNILKIFVTDLKTNHPDETTDISDTENIIKTATNAVTADITSGKTTEYQPWTKNSAHTIADTQRYLVWDQIDKLTGKYKIAPVPVNSTIKLTSDQKYAISGEEITYTINYKNTTGDTISNVNFSVPIPDNTQLVTDSITGGGVNTNNQIIWTMPNLLSNQEFNAEFKVKVI